MPKRITVFQTVSCRQQVQQVQVGSSCNHSACIMRS